MKVELTDKQIRYIKNVMCIVDPINYNELLHKEILCALDQDACKKCVHIMLGD